MATVKTDLCNFSGFKIYPGYGKRFVRADGKLMTFANAKCESLYHGHKNPREISWTLLYRKLHKKGVSEVSRKKRVKRTVKPQRPIDGNTLQSILERRNMTADAKREIRAKALMEAAEKRKEKREKKKIVQAEVQSRAAKQVSHRQATAKVKQPKASNVRVGTKR